MDSVQKYCTIICNMHATHWLYNSSITWCKKAKHRTIVDDANIWGLHNYNNPKGANEE